ncbi:hypothetical protein [Streptomyces abyssomicinicus]|uniref:hypothetical protein n=1 Tax=Streptomyces abyssomicinicus TaxID=574929 RepID=UPI00124FA63A|nr:hypothetical protein [Streptomyces abyssomicinicus]
MSRWYQPHEQWPKHSKPWWRETIQEARSAGWRLKRLDGHTWGHLVCDPSLDEPCKIPIFSTGAAGESAARNKRLLIKRCRHGVAAGATQTLARAAALLDQAERLLQAAAHCLEAADKQDEFDDLVNAALSAGAEAERRLSEAEASEADGDRLLAQAFAVLPDGSTLDCPPSEPQIKVLIADAGARAEEAERLIDDMPGGQDQDALRGRLLQVRQSADDLSVRMAQSRSASGSSAR